ncbi:hydrophobin [Fusarium langsethiae]|uniref:Hydrophobin n=1 Tax=Fusarium langsethiae TaxID=179993 RepID=A0A0M9ELV8_FUSLA|nr:hydrophobin [Fusarium langsethiae]
MKLLSLLPLLFAGALAIPTETDGGDDGDHYIPCGELLYTHMACCSSDGPDVLGQSIPIRGRDCVDGGDYYKSPSAFKDLCAKSGRVPACCGDPFLGFGILCKIPDGF